MIQNSSIRGRGGLVLAVVLSLVLGGPSLSANTDDSEPPTEADVGQAADAPEEISGPRDLLTLMGIDQSHFNLLTDGVPWQDDEDEMLLKIIYRFRRTFRLKDVELWSRGDLEVARLAADPDAFRGEIFQLHGQVVSVEVCRPDFVEVARRFELDEYYRCRLLLDDARQPIEVFTSTIPEAWKADETLDAPAGAFGLFLKLGENEGPRPVFVAPRMAWYPPTRLGSLGMDLGLFDDLSRAGDGPPDASSLKDLQLTGRNRECFYQMLAAVGRAKPGQLLDEATEQLKRTGQERFSVVPLFNQPDKVQGELIVLSGSVRQVIPVRVSDEDVLARFGIDRYYQLFLYTPDSQNNPLVFCVRELPKGMPTGEGIRYNESVSVAGFFFNTWAYRNRQSGEIGEGEWQLAPLLIGRGLKWHPPTKPARNPWLGAIAAGLFVLALLGVWLALWRNSRGDKQFHDQTLSRQFAPDSGKSLNDIGLQAETNPDFSGLEKMDE